MVDLRVQAMSGINVANAANVVFSWVIMVSAQLFHYENRVDTKQEIDNILNAANTL